MTEQVALLTGVSRPEGLGFATARLLAERGFKVIVTARNPARAEEQAAALRAEGHTAVAMQLDVTAPDDPARVAALVTEQFGRLDVLVNNASTMPDMEARSMLDADMAMVRDGLEVDVVGAWAMVQAMRPLLEAAPAGRVVNVSSAVSALIRDGEAAPFPMIAPAHAFAKYCADVLTASLAQAFAGTRVLVNAVDPGQVATHPEFGLDPEDVPAAEAARLVVDAVLLPQDGPSGALFREGARVA